MSSFETFGIHRTILQAITEKGYSAPTPIQEKAIPAIIEEKDIVGCAQTGTGKTAAFAIPILHYLHRLFGGSNRRKEIRTLILSPTRELALQIQSNFEAYGTYTNLRSMVLFGGVNQTPQTDQLKKGVDIVIATPGRLLDLHKQGFINLNHLHHLVIDEADLMLDMGFINDVKKIIQLSPENRQTLLFSATMPMPIRELAENFLNQPLYITIESPQQKNNSLVQKIYYIEKEDKKKLLYHLIRNEKISNAIVFVRAKHGADNVVKALEKNGVKATAIHGDKSQSARVKALESFRNKESDILVATDVAARGIDIDLLPFVINFDLPNITETYIHRIGRTARAGNSGIAISFCGKDEKTYWQDIERTYRIQAKEIKDHPYPWKDSVKKQVEENSTEKPQKKDYRNKNKSRKSEGSKKNKKRWY